MEGIKEGGGRVGVGEDDMGDGMQCSNHPHRNNPGGICAFCLQEKLGKLVSSSFPLPIRASSSSPPSSPPSFRSDIAPSASISVTNSTATSAPAANSSSSSSSLALSVRSISSATKKKGSENGDYHHEYYMRRALIPFLLVKKKKKKPSPNCSSSAAPDVIFKRSKSTATPMRGSDPFLDDDADDDIVVEDFSPRKRNGFWSFLYHSSKSSASSKKSDTKISFGDRNGSPRISAVSAASTSVATTGKPKEKCLGSSLGRKGDMVVEEDNASVSSFERKVSRSRSVGCGSRSFSGDFFERISTGLGDCTLRRVESQREGKPKVAAAAGGAAVNRGGDHHHHHHCMKERVRCGGIFGGFMMTSSSSSSSSSSYWVSSSADDTMNNGESTGVGLSHGRGRSWGWAFASPMRAFSSKNSSKDNHKRDIIRDASDKNATPNLSAIPSLLAVTG